jgi:hypothetical protein
MIELLVAMTVTLIVSGAIYGLLTSGSAAFRREPELADRQQSIRVAMDLITRDVFNAGAGLPTFSQMFTLADPTGACAVGLNGCGPEGSMGAAAAANRAPGDGGDPLTATDVLEIVTTEETCPLRTMCSRNSDGGFPFPGQAGHFVIREAVPPCIAVPGMVMLTDGQDFVMQMTQAGAPNGACPGTLTDPGDATNNGDLLLTAAVPPWVGPGVPPLPEPELVPYQTPGAIFLYSARVVRYRIAPNNDPLDPGPALWRSRSGRYAFDGDLNPDPEPGQAGFSGVNSPWELVARGIEDLQVEYMWGDGQWHNSPMPSTNGNWLSIPRRVRITLSARASAANIQGATVAQGTGPDAVRGQLITEVTPRAAFNELQMGSQIQ